MFPPAPETLCPSSHMLSDFQKDLIKQNKMKPSKCAKLIPQLMKNEKYVCLGVEIIEKPGYIHRYEH